MTCIVATPHFLAADRRVTDDGAGSSMVKVAKNRWLIAAASGNAICTLAVKRAVQQGAESPNDLLQYVDKDSYALVLLPTGAILKISEGAAWACPRGLVEAIGSGADLALGYLGGVAACGYAPTVGTVREALRFVAKRRVDCGGGADFRFFSG